MGDEGHSRPGAVKPVVIVGGGLAGLAAGVELTRRSLPVIVLEQRAIPGGRTYSFLHRDSGDVLDNGQHLLIAGYRHTLGYLERIGSRDLVRIQTPARYLFHHPDRGFAAFQIPRFPPPVGLLAGILRTRLLSWRDRVLMVRAGVSLLAREPHGGRQTIADWLTKTGQSAEARRSFWEPMAISIMNEKPEFASARAFRAALRGAFLQGADSAAAVLPTVGLSDLLIWPAVRAIERGGGVLRCNAAVEALLYEGKRVSGLRLRGGSTVEAGAAILAVPPGHLYAGDTPDWKLGEATAVTEKFSPIITVYLWLQGHPVRDEVVGYLGKTLQWTFDRSALGGRDPHSGQLLAAVISAAREFESVSNDELVKRVAGEIAEAYGEGPLRVRRSLVLRERRATVALTPLFERSRPGSRTAVENLFRAGDWTATGIPATIEGAIQSGVEAASLVAGFAGV